MTAAEFRALKPGESAPLGVLFKGLCSENVVLRVESIEAETRLVSTSYFGIRLDSWLITETEGKFTWEGADK